MTRRAFLLLLALALAPTACSDEPASPEPAKPQTKPRPRGGPSRLPPSTGAPGEVSREELGLGAALLKLTLADAVTGKVTAGRARVWRLGLPESFGFTEGDQIQAAVEVPATGLVLRDLPTGRYRVECASQGRTRPDPPPFVIGETEFPLDVVVHPLAKVPVRIMIFHPDGTLVEEVDRGIPWTDPNAPRRWAPSWAVPRRSRSRSGVSAPRRRTDTSVTGRLVASAEGFDLGTWQEVPHDAAEVSVVRLLPGPEWQQVHVPMEDVLGAPTTFVAVVARTGTVSAGVTTNDADSPARADIESGTEAWSEAVAFPSPPPADAWRRAPIHVRVRVEGFEALEYDWTAATSGASHVLVAISSK